MPQYKQCSDSIVYFNNLLTIFAYKSNARQINVIYIILYIFIEYCFPKLICVLLVFWKGRVRYTLNDKIAAHRMAKKNLGAPEK